MFPVKKIFLHQIPRFLPQVLPKMAGKTVFASEKTSPRSKSNLFAYVLVPMVAIFELGFRLERIITGGGQFFPTLGRQLGVDWNFLMVSVGPWWIKCYQTAFIIVGVFALKAVITNFFHMKNRKLFEYQALVATQRV